MEEGKGGLTAEPFSRNWNGNDLDSIQDRCYPKNLIKAISYHLKGRSVGDRDHRVTPRDG